MSITLLMMKIFVLYFVIQVQLIDFGNATTLPRSDVYQLPEQFADQEKFAKLCHLSGLQPAGDTTRWTKTSTEYLLHLVDETVCYMDQKVL